MGAARRGNGWVRLCWHPGHVTTHKPLTTGPDDLRRAAIPPGIQGPFRPQHRTRRCPGQFGLSLVIVD